MDRNVGSTSKAGDGPRSSQHEVPLSRSRKNAKTSQRGSRRRPGRSIRAGNEATKWSELRFEYDQLPLKIRQKLEASRSLQQDDAESNAGGGGSNNINNNKSSRNTNGSLSTTSDANAVPSLKEESSQSVGVVGSSPVANNETDATGFITNSSGSRDDITESPSSSSGVVLSVVKDMSRYFLSPPHPPAVASVQSTETAPESFQIEKGSSEGTIDLVSALNSDVAVALFDSARPNNGSLSLSSILPNNQMMEMSLVSLHSWPMMDLVEHPNSDVEEGVFGEDYHTSEAVAFSSVVALWNPNVIATTHEYSAPVHGLTGSQNTIDHQLSIPSVKQRTCLPFVRTSSTHRVLFDLQKQYLLGHINFDSGVVSRSAIVQYPMPPPSIISSSSRSWSLMSIESEYCSDNRTHAQVSRAAIKSSDLIRRLFEQTMARAQEKQDIYRLLQNRKAIGMAEDERRRRISEERETRLLSIAERLRRVEITKSLADIEQADRVKLDNRGIRTERRGRCNEVKARLVGAAKRVARKIRNGFRRMQQALRVRRS